MSNIKIFCATSLSAYGSLSITIDLIWSGFGVIAFGLEIFYSYPFLIVISPSEVSSQRSEDLSNICTDFAVRLLPLQASTNPSLHSKISNTPLLAAPQLI